jgi:cytochrome bd-type quinol oxidase subunit 2
MVEALDTWLSNSTTNFNIFVGITGAIVALSLIVMAYATHKIGKRDERATALYLNASSTMLVVLLLLLAIFIAWVDRNTVHFRQFLTAIIALTFASGALSLTIASRKQ